MVGTFGFGGELGMVIDPEKPLIPEGLQPQEPAPQQPQRNDCTNMADRAQQIANDVINSANSWKGTSAAAVGDRYQNDFKRRVTDVSN